MVGDSQQKLLRAAKDEVCSDGWGKETRRRVVTVKPD
jgi:hypothetical protein